MEKRLSLRIIGQPDPNVPKDVHWVGRYALGVTWADDHGSIYPLEHLRRTCACGACADLATVVPAMAWPERVTKTPGALEVAWSDAHQSVYQYPDLRAACRCAGCTGGH